ncbi:MAG: hypothetical protein JXR96_23195 [Deltaproteobacteria bacterium]|nr:hypothetical protein [Deltaproteobacteria bacterium]
METSSKKDLALGFLGELASMRPDRLQDIIRQVVGEDLAAIMFGYSKQVMEAAPDKQLENASSLMILGYLIRVHEQGGIPPATPPV